MSNLSIFVDESGDFGPVSKHAPYYIVTMVFHNQNVILSEQINNLNKELENIGYYNHVIHTEPLIRREEDYKNLSPNERRCIFSKLYYFVKKSKICYKAFVFKKQEYSGTLELGKRMIKELSKFIREHLEYFQEFDKIILYYDNGQQELNQILHTVFCAELSQYEARRVLPCNYKLFQAADLICTLELLKAKLKVKSLSKSEKLIFHSERDLRKDFLKGLQEMVFDK